ncbi:17287_t:CDS:2, partial [Cetraspora pellucida]
MPRNAKSKSSCDEILKYVGDLRFTFISMETMNVYDEDPFKVTPILDNDIRTSNSLHEISSHLEPEKLSRIPSNTSTVTTNPETLESTDDKEINESELRRRRINIEATDRISITLDIINTTVEPDFVVEQNGSFHENSTAAIHLSSSPTLISRLPYIIMVIYSYIFEDISWWKLLKLVIMVLKVITCLTLCSPYLPSLWVPYPILIFAIFDLLS